MMPDPPTFTVREARQSTDHAGGSALDTLQYRGHPSKLAKFQSRINIRLHSFPFRVVNPSNGLPDSVVVAPLVNSFKYRLHTTGALGEL